MLLQLCKEMLSKIAQVFNHFKIKLIMQKTELHQTTIEFGLDASEKDAVDNAAKQTLVTGDVDKFDSITDLTPHQRLKHEMARYALHLGKSDLEEFILILLQTYFDRVMDTKKEVSDESSK